MALNLKNYENKIEHNGTRLKCRFNALLADVIGWFADVQLKDKLNL